MKKKFFATITPLVLFFEPHAQSEKNKIIFGIKGGYNHSIINGYEANGGKTGFVDSAIYGSLFGERGIGENKFLGAELNVQLVNDWNFLEMPVHLRQMLNRQISIFAEPKLDLAADQFDKTKESESRLLSISAAGAQYDFSRHLFGEVKYSVGVTRNFNDAPFDINNGR